MIRKLLELQSKAWVVAMRAAVLPATCLFRRNERYLVWRLSEVCVGAQRPGVYPEVPLGALVNRATLAHVFEIPAESYNVTEYELLALAAMTSSARADIAFEFGTADGRTTRILASNVLPFGHVYTLNIPLYRDNTHRQKVAVGFRFQGCAESRRITQLWGDSKSFDFDSYHRRCQLVFIDADHAESSVLSDSQTALTLVDQRRGIIIWHDALRYGVQKALPRLMWQFDLPIHLISGTNLAVLCFANGSVAMPGKWAEEIKVGPS